MASGFLLVSCASEQGFSSASDGSGVGGPQIFVDPEFLDFGQAGQDDTVVRSFTVTNVGEGDLEVSGIEIGAGVASFTILNEYLSFILPEQATEEIQVAFTPLGANEQQTDAIVSSNDEESPRVSVTLSGVGMVPDIEIDPNPYDFGEIYLGCERSGEVDIINVGEEPVTISEIGLDATPFTLYDPNILPLTLENNGDFITVEVGFSPDQEAAFAGDITVISDAPGSPDLGTITGSAIYAGDYTDRWELDENPPVDLAFFVDRSGSMDNDASDLARNFSTFIGQLSNYTSDWQIMVVTKDSGCNNNGILTQSLANYDTLFQSAVQQGGGFYTEALLYLSYQAIEKTDSGECNTGFMRDDALLHIIYVSDEPDQSPNDWSYYVSALQDKKGDAANVKLSAVAGDYPGGCATAEAGDGYYQAVAATGGEFLSICSEWSSNIEALADASIQLSEYSLSHTPDPDTLLVTVDGARVNTWHYDEAANSVIFDSNIPEGGETIEISYSYLVACDG